MTKKTDQTLVHRILSFFVVVCIIVVSQGFYSIKALQSANKSINSVNESNLQVEELLEEILHPMTNMRLLSMELVLAPNLKSIEKLNMKVKEQIKLIDAALIAWEKKHSRFRLEFSSINSAWLSYKNIHAQTAMYVNSSNRIASFITLTQQEKQAYESLYQRLNHLNQMNNKLNKEVYEKALEMSLFTFATLVIATVVTIAILIGIMFTIQKMVRGYIQAKKEYETELSDATCQANAANSAKSEFLANMSHEIRTPMNAILGFTDILQRKISEPQERRYVENIHSSGKALLSLINDILDLSKIESGKLMLQLSPICIQGLFDELRTVFEQKADDLDLDFLLEVDPKLPKALVLDETRLRQVLINLAGNALKFTEKGFVKLKVDCVPSDGAQNQMDIRIKVQDTGIGIPDDEQGQVFAAFEQMSGQNHKEYGGTGLGLAICQSLVDLMNGRISIESKVGEGSTFEIFIPNVEIASSMSQEENQVEDLDYSRLKFKKSSVLIVDDVDYNREIVLNFLDGYDLSIDDVESGELALSFLEEKPVDLILLDMKMPGISGYEVSQRLKADERLSSIPIVAVTASALTQDEDVIKQFCDGYLRKPVSRNSLIKEVMKHLKYEIKEVETQSVSHELEPEQLSKEKRKECLDACEGQLLPLIASLEESPGNIGVLMEMSTVLSELSEKYPEENFVAWNKDFQRAYESFNNKQIEVVMDRWLDVCLKILPK